MFVCHSERSEESHIFIETRRILARSQMFEKEILENILEPITVLDFSGKILYCKSRV